MSGPAGRENAALRPGEAAGCGGFFTKPQIQNSRFKIQNYKLGAQPAEAPFEADLRDRFHLRTARGIVSVRQDGSPQPPIFAEIFCSKLDCAAVGNPQPPPPAEGCNLAQLESRPFRPAAGRPCGRDQPPKRPNRRSPGCGPPGPAPAPRTVRKNGRFGLRQPARPHRRSTKRQRDHPIAPTRL